MSGPTPETIAALEAQRQACRAAAAAHKETVRLSDFARHALAGPDDTLPAHIAQAIVDADAREAEALAEVSRLTEELRAVLGAQR